MTTCILRPVAHLSCLSASLAWSCANDQTSWIASRRRIENWHCGLIFAEWNKPYVPPEKSEWGQSSPVQPQGFWIRRKDFIQEFFNSSKRWLVRHHPDWLAPIESDVVFDSVEIMEQPLNRGFLMLAEMVFNGRSWREETRWVLVHDEWGLNKK